MLCRGYVHEIIKLYTQHKCCSLFAPTLHDPEVITSVVKPGHWYWPGTFCKLAHYISPRSCALHARLRDENGTNILFWPGTCLARHALRYATASHDFVFMHSHCITWLCFYKHSSTINQKLSMLDENMTSESIKMKNMYICKKDSI